MPTTILFIPRELPYSPFEVCKERLTPRVVPTRKLLSQVWKLEKVWLEQAAYHLTKSGSLYRNTGVKP